MTHDIHDLLQSPDEDVRLRTVLELATPESEEDLPPLVAMLADPNWRVRKAVAQVLVKADVNLVVPLLVQTLSSGTTGIQNVRFQNAAIECLTAIGQPAIPGLTIALHDPNKDVRISAANALGSIQHRDACDALIAALKDEHINVRYAVVEALSKIPSQQSVIPLTRILEGNEEWLKLPAISALGHIGDYRATPYLMKMTQNPLYLQTAVEALGNIGDECGIPCILDALSSTDKEIRKSAVLSLEHIARKLDKFHAIIQQPSTYRALFRSAFTEQMMHYLIEFTNDTDETLAMAAIKLLGWSASQEAAYVLLEKLGDEQVQEIVTIALNQIGEQAITPLAHAYETSKSLERKLLLLDCLRELEREQVLQLLLKYLKDSKEELLVHALIKSLTQPTFITLLTSNTQTTALETLLPALKEYLKSPHPLIRAEAVYLWGQLRGIEALDDLLNATKDTHPAVRVNAIKHLGHFAKHHQELTQHLIILLSDDHPQIRKQAALSLGDSESVEAFPALLLVLDDSDAIVRRAAVTGLGTYLAQHPREPYDQQVIEKLADVLEHRCRRYEDGLLKIEICHALQHIIAERSKELLLHLALDFDFDVRKSAILALGAFAPYKTTLTSVLLMFLQDEHWSVREAAVTTLGVLHVQEAEANLLGLLDDPDLTVRKSLLIALGRIDAIQAIPTLVKHLADHDLDASAYQALTMLATRHNDLIMSHFSNENPKIHLFIEHILGTPHP